MYVCGHKGHFPSDACSLLPLWSLSVVCPLNRNGFWKSKEPRGIKRLSCYGRSQLPPWIVRCLIASASWNLLVISSPGYIIHYLKPRFQKILTVDPAALYVGILVGRYLVFNLTPSQPFRLHQSERQFISSQVKGWVFFFRVPDFSQSLFGEVLG